MTELSAARKVFLAAGTLIGLAGVLGLIFALIAYPMELFGAMLAGFLFSDVGEFGVVMDATLQQGRISLALLASGIIISVFALRPNR